LVLLFVFFIFIAISFSLKHWKIATLFLVQKEIVHSKKHKEDGFLGNPF